MSSFSLIQQKLEQFIKKYYTNELIKGAILFFAIGLLWFLITLLLEYFLWLNPSGRTILFWTFVVVEAGLFVRFIAFPLMKLFKLQQGISNEDAATIIGSHFPQVSDKLLNVIQLNQNQRESELLAASIDQKAGEMQPVVFNQAVNFKKNAKYLKYAAIPLVIFGLVSLLGEKDTFSSSYERVVNYDTAYEPPAPFSFYVLNENLNAIENKPFTIQVRTEGEAVPEKASVIYNGESYFLQQTAPGVFEYTFLQPYEDITFELKANKVTSKEYSLSVVKTPSLLGFEMILDFPSYTGRRDEVLKSTGNGTVPEGTRASWKVQTKNTDKVSLKLRDTSFLFSSKGDQFNFDKGIYSKLDYAITTSNSNLKEYENLSFTLNVIKDEYPEIDVQSKQDSLSSEIVYFLGDVSDDYGLTKLQLVYYPDGQQEAKKFKTLTISKSNVDQFIYTFPGDIDLTEGVSYEYYFEIFDNDQVHNFKSTKSGVYNFRKLTEDELENEQLQNQDNAIKGMDKALDEMKKQDKRLEEIEKLQKEKEELNWNDQKKLEDVLKRQKQQEQMMQKFSKELQENLENFQPENEEKDPFKEKLEERLEKNQEKLKENEKLLEELEKLQEKLTKEELTEKLEKVSKQNKNQEKNLEQLLELTKRYYVNKKSEKLAEELFKLGEEQEQLADKPKEENTKEEQEKINEKFEQYKKEMEKLQEENEALKDPMKMEQDKIGEKIVDKEQENATDKLEKQDSEGAKKSQKNAGKKMQEMGQQMQMQMASGGEEQIQEDVAMLRQILDNLVVFSFRQEGLMEEFKTTDYGNPIFGKRLNIQNDLKQNFQHIDDSLFTLSLRQPALSEEINESITEVQYNIDKSMERLAENQLRQGISSQQYTVTGTNELANLLTNMLTNMQQQSMGQGSGGSGQGQPSPGQGSGSGQGFQLPDIIEKQKSLGEKMEEGMGKGEGNKGEGEGEGEGKGEGEGEGEGEGQGEGEGDGDGKGSENGNGGAIGNDSKEGNGESENNDGELYEIYKQQQQLRQELEDKLSKEGLDGRGGDLLKKMEQIEDQLLDKGFNQRTLEKMLNLQYELLKLEEADFEQGQDTKRESQTNKKKYNNTLRMTPEDIKKYFNTTEILNREALPLRPEYKQKVQTYFKKIND
ncbi:ATPase [Patiriisocius marinus]|uniref:ATPase n=1 Tax=Patiriisocius marinus TaxID=1397112 RepID=A0A5J4IV26_9FLAO|nr:DUF4175 family protein [Patiriisocius marinus]GER58654.1 ATPase [Patiriisocius marinus]